MSYDICYMVDRPVDVLDKNITYNLSKMYYAAMEAVGIKHDRITNWLHDRKGGDILPELNKFIEELENNKEKYEEFNPENGWGSYEGLLNIFKKLQECCKEDLNGVIKIY